MDGQKEIEVFLPSYVMSPSETSKFYPSQVKTLALSIMQSLIDAQCTSKMMDEWQDDGEEFELLGQQIAEQIKDAVRDSLNMERYKLLVQVTVGQRKDQGVRITSRCLWDTVTDNYASVEYKGEQVWGSAMVFGLYAE